VEALESRFSDAGSAGAGDDDAPPVPAGTAAKAGTARVLFDPATGEYFQVPIALFNAPASNAPAAPAPDSSKSAANKFYENMFIGLADDLEYYGKMHPGKAEKLAARYVKQAEKTGESIDVILRNEAKNNPDLIPLLKVRAEETAQAAGLKLAPATEPAPVVPATPAAGAAITPVPPPNSAGAAGASVTRTTPPPAGTGTVDANEQAKAIGDHIDDIVGMTG
jgi:hypothetical protein